MFPYTFSSMRSGLGGKCSEEGSLSRLMTAIEATATVREMLEQWSGWLSRVLDNGSFASEIATHSKKQTLQSEPSGRAKQWMASWKDLFQAYIQDRRLENVASLSLDQPEITPQELSRLLFEWIQDGRNASFEEGVVTRGRSLYEILQFLLKGTISVSEDAHEWGQKFIRAYQSCQGRDVLHEESSARQADLWDADMPCREMYAVAMSWVAEEQEEQKRRQRLTFFVQSLGLLQEDADGVAAIVEALDKVLVGRCSFEAQENVSAPVWSVYFHEGTRRTAIAEFRPQLLTGRVMPYLRGALTAFKKLQEHCAPTVLAVLAAPQLNAEGWAEESIEGFPAEWHQLPIIFGALQALPTVCDAQLWRSPERPIQDGRALWEWFLVQIILGHPSPNEGVRFVRHGEIETPMIMKVSKLADHSSVQQLDRAMIALTYLQTRQGCEVIESTTKLDPKVCGLLGGCELANQCLRQAAKICRLSQDQQVRVTTSLFERMASVFQISSVHRGSSPTWGSLLQEIELSTRGDGSIPPLVESPASGGVVEASASGGVVDIGMRPPTRLRKPLPVRPPPVETTPVQYLAPSQTPLQGQGSSEVWSTFSRNQRDT